MPLTSRLEQAGLQLNVVTANIEMARWLQGIANEYVYGKTAVQPSVPLRQERACPQVLPAPWRSDIAAARALAAQGADTQSKLVRSAVVAEHIARYIPMQHPLAVYEQLLAHITHGAAA